MSKYFEILLLNISKFLKSFFLIKNNSIVLAKLLTFNNKYPIRGSLLTFYVYLSLIMFDTCVKSDTHMKYLCHIKCVYLLKYLSYQIPLIEILFITQVILTYYYLLYTMLIYYISSSLCNSIIATEAKILERWLLVIVQQKCTQYLRGVFTSNISIYSCTMICIISSHFWFICYCYYYYFYPSLKNSGTHNLTLSTSNILLPLTIFVILTVLMIIKENSVCKSYHDR